MKAQQLPRQVRERPIGSKPEELAHALNREIVPALRKLEDHVRDIYHDAGQVSRASVTGSLGGNERLVLVDASGGAVVITLAAADEQRAIVVVKKIDSSSNVVTVLARVGETIDGAAGVSLPAQYDSVRLDSDGGSFWVVG